MKFKIIFIAAFCCSTAFAQRKAIKPQAIIVAGKILSYEDSLRVKQLFYAALKDKTIGNSAQAIEKFNTILSIDPANHASMYEIGYFLHNQVNEAQAETFARKAVTVAPENKWYWLLLADIYKKTNNLPQLTLVFDELIRLSPDNEDYYFDKASSLVMQRRIAEAEDVYSVIAHKFGNSTSLSSARNKILYQLEKPAAEIYKDLEAQIKQNPSDLKLYLTLADVYNKSKNLKKATEVLEEAKKIDPVNALVRLSLADIYRNQDNFDKAFIELKVAFADPAFSIDEKIKIIASFSPLFADAKARAQAEELALIATKTHPNSAAALNIYGDVLYQQGKSNQAEQIYKEALKLDDQNYQAWERLIRVQLEKGNHQAAVSTGMESLTVFPNQPQLYLYTGIALMQLQNPAKAVPILEDGINLNPQDSDVLSQLYSTLADAYHAINKHTDSDLAYEKALKLNPDNVYPLNNYAYYLSLRGEKLELAEQMSKRSIALDPGNSAFEDTYAWILFKLKRYKEAKTWIENALKHDSPVTPGKLEHYGDILYHLNEAELAVEQWKKAKANGLKSDILEKKINEKRYFE